MKPIDIVRWDLRRVLALLHELKPLRDNAKKQYEQLDRRIKVLERSRNALLSQGRGILEQSGAQFNTCPRCHGSGWSLDAGDFCPHCDGDGSYKSYELIHARYEEGNR